MPEETETKPLQIMMWPLGGFHEGWAVIAPPDGDSTIIHEFRPKGTTDEERLAEMKQWIEAHNGFDITLLDESLNGKPLVGYTFMLTGPAGLEWYTPIVSG